MVPIGTDIASGQNGRPTLFSDSEFTAASEPTARFMRAEKSSVFENNPACLSNHKG
jgi:hypothetical protein